MKAKKSSIRLSQTAALAGMITVMSAVPAKVVWAAGPGEGIAGPVPTTTVTPGNSGPGGGGSSNSSSNSGPGAQGKASADGSTAVNPNAWKRSGSHYLMPDGSLIANVFRRGIDVSRWQGDVNWSQVAADDISFVMLGTRSKGAVDPYFHKNIQEACSAGVQVGVYIYSLATTPEMAVAEADFVINLIKDYPVSYPVALDMEDDVQAVLSKEELAAIANAFCGRISEAGYYPIIYANEYWLNHYLDLSKMNYPVWVARYSQKPAFASPVMWQATSSGSVKGISGNVDIDFQFQDFSGVIPSHTWRNIGGNSYYYANYALQKENWIHDGDGWYYMGGDGLAVKSWQILDGERYYLDENSGKMQIGWQADNGAWYYLGSSGAPTRGWVNDNGAWYYTDQTGVMKTGWLEDGGQRYFLKENGQRAVGWRQIDGFWYCFDEEGRMMTEWQMINGAWQYFGNDGHMATGLIEVGGVSYYLNPDNGQMVSDTTLTIGDVTYHADGSGALSAASASEETENPSNPTNLTNPPVQGPGGANP